MRHRAKPYTLIIVYIYIYILDIYRNNLGNESIDMMNFPSPSPLSTLYGAQTVGLSIAFSIGLAAYLGFFYTPLHTVSGPGWRCMFFRGGDYSTKKMLHRWVS